jgi:eukaryotic-like serine/threonine-protein kinase
VSTPQESRTPPFIPGYEFIRDLGAGGYSVVYLYRQASLNREVAVKVLRDFDLDDVVRERFTAEATAMVQLGNHPNIVDVLDTGIAQDGSRYLIMRYYPGGNLAQRSARRGLPVAEVLDIGLKLADAVKTVHAAHLVHRDIKPANVLIDDANHNYRLSDFGIAGRLVSGHAGDAFGISVPWSAPEVVLGETGGSVASDVYSLGATLWHLLIGRSPFRLEDGDNSRPVLEARICAGQLPPMPRPDVPRALTDLLTGMMAPIWYARPALADVIRDLAAVDGGQGPARFVPPSPYGGRAPGPGYPPGAGYQSDESDSTSMRRPAGNAADLTVAAYNRAGQEPRPGTGGASGTGGTGTGRTGQNSSGRSTATYGNSGRKTISYGEDGSQVDSDQNRSGDEWLDADAEAPRRRWIVPTAIGVVVLAAGIGVATLNGGGSPKPGPTASAASADQQNPGQLGQDEPPGPVTVTATRVSPLAVQFTWSYSDELANDSFQWQTSDGLQSGVVPSPMLTLQDKPGVQLCIEVKVVRADGSDGSVDWSQEGCGQ